VGAVAGRVEEASAGATAEDAAIVVDGVSKRFGATVAVDDCSLSVERGAFVSLLGPSGCGKTTLLRIIGGFESQNSGSIQIHGEKMDGRPPNNRPVNMVFQRYALFPHKNVLENIAFPLELKRVSKKERRERVREMLALVRLPGVEDRSPNELSGGQAQRVALARALVARPEVLLLDEPLTALDLKLRKAMQLELRRIQETLGTTFLYVTHDQEEALTMSDRIALMNEGSIVQEGAPAEIYQQPRSVFASHFIGEANLLHGEVVDSGEGMTRVRADGLELAAPPGDLEASDRAVVSVRPERIGIGVPGTVRDCDNRFTGRLVRHIFLGNLTRWIVELAPELVVTVESGVEGADLAERDEVEVAWQSGDSILLREE
jgi:spermidine/putrescine transport system ATP-binding protein